ncbi:MAG: hypothetical protein ABR924_19400 [Terracidiphilus sp.]|jgi:hypothetical protein
MSQHRFQAESFTPTKWSTAEQKASFANQLMAFIAADFPANKFTKALYNRLSQCFGMIAHYNCEGFFDTFFTDFPGKLRFLKCLTEWPCYGSSEYTFSDVECATSAAIRSMGYVEIYDARLRRESETRERAILALLQAKYNGSEASTTVEPVSNHELVFAARFAPASVPTPVDAQFALFG